MQTADNTAPRADNETLNLALIGSTYRVAKSSIAVHTVLLHV